MTRTETIGDCTLYLGDCLDILPTLGPVDAVVTDPPYGVGFDYDLIDDTPEFIANTVRPAVDLALARAARAAITPGTRNVAMYPQPAEMGCLYFPAGAGFSRWGFTCFQPILFYGKDPDPPNRKRPNSRAWTRPAEKTGHPCCKPLGLMKWLIERVSLEFETIIDPFMGSGTTGVACAKLGRKFIGIEISEQYFDIACKRIEKAYAQPDLFVPQPAEKPQQLDILEAAE